MLRLLRMHANDRETIAGVGAGDIAAAVGLRKAGTGDTLCDEEEPVLLERMQFPVPVVSHGDRAEAGRRDAGRLGGGAGAPPRGGPDLRGAPGPRRPARR